MKEIIITKLVKLFPRIFFNIFRKLYRKKLTYNLLNIISKGFNIQNVYDVGAHKGLWSKSLKGSLLKNSNFFLFEANLSHEKDLISTGYPYFINLLSDTIKEVKFYNNNNTGDSYFMENTNEYEEKNFVIKTTTTLDVIVKNENLFANIGLTIISTELFTFFILFISAQYNSFVFLFSHFRFDSNIACSSGVLFDFPSLISFV